MKGTQLTIGENQRQKVFYNNLSVYLELINNNLSKKIKIERLGNHIKVLGGYAFKSSQYQKEGIPVIRISDFQNEKIDLVNAKCYEEKTKYNRYQLFEGDIIIAMTGGTIGKLGIVQEGLGKLYLNQRVGKFQILKPEEFFDKYIYWLARGIQEKVKGFGYGGAQPNISGKQIEELEFPIPDKKLQEKIVNFLECLRDDCLEKKEYFDMKTEKDILRLQDIGKSLFNVLENSQKDETLLKKLKQSILQEAVQGKLVPQNKEDEPASELLKKIKAEKEKLIKEGKIKKGKELPPIEEDEVPYELPEGWEWCRLGDVCTLITDGSHNPPKGRKEGIPMISATNVLNDEIVFNEKLRYISKEEYEMERKRNPIEMGDVLLTIVGTIGRTCVVNIKDKFCLQRSVALIKSEINSKYLSYYLRSPLVSEGFIERGKGTAQKGIYLGKLSETLLLLPSLAEQKRIVEKVDALMRFCDKLELGVKENKVNSENLMGGVLREVFENGD